MVLKAFEAIRSGRNERLYEYNRYQQRTTLLSLE